MAGVGAWDAKQRGRVVLCAVLGSISLVSALLVADRGGGDDEMAVAVGSSGTMSVPDERLDRAVDGDEPTSTTSTAPGETTSTSAVEVGGSIVGDDGSVRAPDEPDPTTTTVCLDSFDPGCGAFRWTAAPQPNQPMTASIELLTPNPVVGEKVYFRIKASDPDAVPLSTGVWGPGDPDGPGLTFGNCYPHGVREGFGPWAPPAPRPGSFDEESFRPFLEPGTYRVYACISSISWPIYESGDDSETWCPGDPSSWAFEGFTCRDPYGSFATPFVDVVVAPAQP